MSFKVVGIGEVLWDLLPSGPQLGGAPANFACHAKMLGAQAHVITRIGRDALGGEILRRLTAMGIADGTVQVDDRAPTGIASIILQADGVPCFKLQEDAAWDHLALTDAALKCVQEAQAVCFGSLAQRSQSAPSIIKRLVAAAPFGSLKVFDINLRQKYYTKNVIEQSLGLANVLKLNDQELPILAEMFALTGTERQQIEQLLARFDFRLVALTRGSQGSLLWQAGQWSDLPGRPVQVVDTVGAGDAFTAALVMGLLREMSLIKIHQLASEVAGFVCSYPGATPTLPERLREKFN